MNKWEVTAFCPLCKQPYQAKKVRTHIKELHPDAPQIDRDRIEALAQIALNSAKGPKKSKTKEIKNSTDVLSAYRNGYSGTVSGGAFSQGKK